MALKQITSPGVQIREIDQSSVPVGAGGTSVLVAGFAQQGPVDEVFALGSMAEFERVYGMPSNAAERYFHASARAVFNSNGNVLSTRLPYGTGGGYNTGNSEDQYTALFFPVFPYGSHSIDNFGTGSETVVAAATAATGVSLSASTTDVYVFGKPQLIQLDRENYDKLSQGDFNWDDDVAFNTEFSSTDSTTWGKAGMIVVNKIRSAINDKYEGHYIAMTDNTELNPATNFTSVETTYTVNETTQDLSISIPSTRLDFVLSGTPTSNDESISEQLEELPTFDISGDEYDDTAIMAVFKLRSTIFGNDTLKLDNIMLEPMIGSFDSFRKIATPAGGNPRSFFLGDVDNASQHVDVLVNRNISYSPGRWTASDGINPSRKIRFLTRQLCNNSISTTLSGGVTQQALDSLVSNIKDQTAASGFNKTCIGTLDTTNIATGASTGNAVDALIPLGHYVKSDPQLKTIGAIPDKLGRIFQQIDNVDVVDIDITVEGGLGSIYAGAQDFNTNGPADRARDIYDDEFVIPIGTIDHTAGTQTGLYEISEGASLGSRVTTYRDNYRAVFDKFNVFAEDNRKDHIFIADAPRHIFVNGINDTAMRDKRRTFTQAVYWPLRHVFGHANTSYSTVFGNWGKCYDGAADALFWCPFSGYAAATMANSDARFGPWYAPAGFKRGRFGGVVDLAVEPSQKHRDQLYKINVNPVTRFPGEGNVIFGQKTMFKKPSAFDRLNVRRLFLFMEKQVRRVMKYYVFEPNTMLTRTQVLNNLTPLFERVRVNQGLYNYMIICDQRNNTPTTIDANQLVVDIYMKPVRAAEIILVNFHASRTSQSFTEITGY